MLAPVREHAARREPPPEALDRLTAHWLGFASTNGPKVGGPEGAVAVVLLGAEWANLERAFGLALAKAADPAIDAATALTKLVWMGGLGSNRMLLDALSRLAHSALSSATATAPSGPPTFGPCVRASPSQCAVSRSSASVDGSRRAACSRTGASMRVRPPASKARPSPPSVSRAAGPSTGSNVSTASAVMPAGRRPISA